MNLNKVISIVLSNIVFFMPLSAFSSQELNLDIDKHLSELSSNIVGFINPSSRCRGMYSERLEWLNKQLGNLKNDPIKIINATGFYGSTNTSYSDFIIGMETWALYNIDDYIYYNKFMDKLEKLKIVLAIHYVDNLGYEESKGKIIANNSVNLFLAKVLDAYDYLPIDNKSLYDLRKLILSKGNINKIKGFNDMNALKIPYEMPTGRLFSPTEKESLLSISIDYPEALEHLLSIGISPNHTNDFGKTPLMYAVQRNQLRSVKILLDYGAKINETTKKINHSCGFYDLSQYDVSALHYAARYAGKDVISLLLSHGASRTLYSGLRKPSESIPSGTPYQWFKFINPDFKQHDEKLAISNMLDKK
jgi:hypothetical protein